MLLDWDASTVASVAWMAKKLPVIAPVPLIYSPPFSPNPLYSDTDPAMMFLWLCGGCAVGVD
jgi:hypothetical protein